MDDLIKRLRDIGRLDADARFKAADALERMQWQPIETAPKDSTRVLLTIYIDGKRQTASGGWDDHWTGECWVYDSKRIPDGTTPIYWMPLPAPPLNKGEKK